jgi:hypothetical protein
MCYCSSTTAYYYGINGCAGRTHHGGDAEDGNKMKVLEKRDHDGAAMRGQWQGETGKGQGKHGRKGLSRMQEYQQDRG